jgi:hypothetical protein
MTLQITQHRKPTNPDRQPRCHRFESPMVDLTWHNPNSLVLVEGPEIMIQPVGIRRLPSTIAQVSGCGHGWSIRAEMTSRHAVVLAGRRHPLDDERGQPGDHLLVLHGRHHDRLNPFHRTFAHSRTAPGHRLRRLHSITPRLPNHRVVIHTQPFDTGQPEGADATPGSVIGTHSSADYTMFGLVGRRGGPATKSPPPPLGVEGLRAGSSPGTAARSSRCGLSPRARCGGHVNLVAVVFNDSDPAGP